MAKSNYMTTIAIDTNNSAFHFYSMIGNDKTTIAHNIKSYAGGRLDDEFFGKFKDAVKEFTANTPSESIRKVTVILPDSAVLTDTVKIPTMKGVGQTQKMLDVTLGGLYRNYKDMRIIAHMADQNKQYSTFAVEAVQNHIVSSIYAACSENKMLVETLTFASASAVGAASLLNPKLRNASYLFLDIKDIYSRFAFVIGGKVMGYYTLPFGLEFLRKPRVVQEDMLFDHSYAELIVLNARERAKSKKLTVMAFGDDSSRALAWEAQNADNIVETGESVLAYDQVGTEEDIDEVESEEFIEQAHVEEPAVVRSSSNPKLFVRKTPRNLPKFMLREKPETIEGITYENFRVFVKWALTLIHGNDKLTEIGKPQFVCVNLPCDLAYVIDMVNQEAEENGISFTLLSNNDQESEVSANLELYGGLFPKQISSANKF